MRLKPSQAVLLETDAMHEKPEDLEIDITEIVLRGGSGEIRSSGERFFVEFETGTTRNFCLRTNNLRGRRNE